MLAVFVFYCPDEAKVRTKMLMATCKSAVIQQAFEKHKIEFEKQVAFDLCKVSFETATYHSTISHPTFDF